MHRHGYQGRKFHRQRDQRSALIKSLAESLIKYEKIETTEAKAKEVVPYVEKLITKAMKGDLANRRRVIAGLQTMASAHKLVDDMAPKFKGRSSGHLRIRRSTLRRGDGAQLAVVSFVDNLQVAAATAPTNPTTKPPLKPDVKRLSTTAKPVKKTTTAAVKAKAKSKQEAK